MSNFVGTVLPTALAAAGATLAVPYVSDMVVEPTQEVKDLQEQLNNPKNNTSPLTQLNTAQADYNAVNKVYDILEHGGVHDTLGNTIFHDPDMGESELTANEYGRLKNLGLIDNIGEVKHATVEDWLEVKNREINELQQAADNAQAKIDEKHLPEFAQAIKNNGLAAAAIGGTVGGAIAHGVTKGRKPTEKEFNDIPLEQSHVANVQMPRTNDHILQAIHSGVANTQNEMMQQAMQHYQGQGPQKG